MYTLLFSLGLILGIVYLNECIKKYHKTLLLHQPRPIEGEENEKIRERYNELRHKAAPGVSWRQIEAHNADVLRSHLLSNQPGSFGNGAINGTWSSKGATNQTGNVRSVDYVASSNMIYTVSNGGTLWSTVAGSGNWTILNQSMRFDPGILRVFNKLAGGTRILVSSNQNIYYSDDNGQTLVPSTGLDFPVPWPGNNIVQLLRVNGSNTIYCLARPWDDVPWAPRYWLYKSADEGLSFTKIYTFNFGDDDQLFLCNPYNSTALYAEEINTIPGSIHLYTISGSNVTSTSTFNVGGNNTVCVMRGNLIAGVTTLYTIINNTDFYKSTDLGNSWTLQSNLPENAWKKLNVSPANANIVDFGGVNAYRSPDAGVTWTKVNDWTDYYGDIAHNLHADIMEIEYYKKSDNTEFAIINTHGGTYLSYDHLNTVFNQSLSGHKAQEYYDVLTDTLLPNRIFCGTQDQGLQETFSGTSPGSQNFIQITSGDFGHMNLTHNNQILWPQYPGGQYYFFTNLGDSVPTYIGDWLLPGSQLSNYGWIQPARSTSDIHANSIWIGGGDLTGGAGSYLDKVTMDSTPPYAVTATQFDYDFRAHSISGTAGVTALEQSLINPNKLFVAMEDGTFFYSNNSGASWNITNAFTGPAPWYLYGSCILASKKNDNVIWYGGSGYSNPGVYKSVDGGVTFSSMSNGLPPTLVNEMVASQDEQYIFAATETGPFVYVSADSTWYSLSDNTTPVQLFSSVEFLPAFNIVRFGTMGHGIWDFHITCMGSSSTWTGAVSTAWENPANWGCGVLPTSTSNVIIDSGYTVLLSSNASVASLKLRHGAHITVNSGFNLHLLGH